MRVVGASRLLAYRRKRRRTDGALRAWLHEVRKAEWATPADLKVWHPSASLLENDLVAFRIEDDRLLVRVDYAHRLICIEGDPAATVPSKNGEIAAGSLR